MSRVKNSPAFAEMMEQARRDDDLMDQRYAEEIYLTRRKGLIPPDETVSLESKQTAERHNTKTHANDH